jgi:hypothetical protein
MHKKYAFLIIFSRVARFFSVQHTKIMENFILRSMVAITFKLVENVPRCPGSVVQWTSHSNGRPGFESRQGI